MKTTKKLVLSIISCILMITTVFLPIYASAGVITSGSCGDNTYYTIYSGGHLVVSGNGEVEGEYLSRYSITRITYQEGVTNTGDFGSLSDVVKVEFPTTLKTIDSNTFYNCYDLKTLVFSEGLETIGSYAFSGCKGLETVSFPASLKTIGSSAFYKCSKLKVVEFQEGLETLSNGAFYQCTALTDILFPSTLKMISEHAFYECTGLKTVNFAEDGAATIGDASFIRCNNIEIVNMNSAVDVIEANAFMDCSSLRSVNVDKGLLEIGSNAFYDCTSLYDFDFPSTLKTIGNSAFYGCVALSSVNLGNSVTSIGPGAFSGCTSVSEVTLSKNLTTIGDNAFYNCSGFSKLVIPSKVTSIGEYAFSGCSSLNEVIVYSKNVSYDYYCFSGTSSNLIYRGYPNSTTEKFAGDSFVSFVCKAPKLVSVKNYADGITITWEKSADAINYRIYRKVNGATSWTMIATVGSGTTRYKDKDVASGSKYCYTVRAIGELADGDYNKKGLTIVRLAAPSNPTVASTKTGVSVKWKSVKGANSYYVYRSQNNGSVKRVATVTGLSYLDKKVVYNTNYSYYIVAVNKNGSVVSTSARSQPGTVKNKYVLSTTITSARVKKMGTVEIKWSTVIGATSYYVYRSTNAKTGFRKIGTVSKNVYLDNTVKTGTKYYYKVVAVTGRATSGYSPVANVTATLSKTTFSSASVDSSSITLKWKKISEADGYYVYRKSGNSWKRIATIKGASTTSYKDNVKGLQVYRIVTYTVKSGKVYTSAIEEGTFRTLGKPSITVDMYNNDFKEIVKWKKITGANQYQVYRKAGSKGSWGKAATTDKLQYIGNVRHGIYYGWKVRAVYKKDGKLSIGKFSAVEELAINQLPSLRIWVSDETDPDASGVYIHIKNNGDYPVTFYSRGARIWNGSDYPHLNGSITMFDYDAIRDGKLIYISSCKIPANSEAWLAFDITGPSRGWYDADTRISVYFKYGTADYLLTTNAHAYASKGSWKEV